MSWEQNSIDLGDLYRSMIRFNNMREIVEIGVATATTTKYLCEAVKPNGGHVWGYDLWDTHGLNNQFPAFSSKEACENYLRSNGHGNFTLTQVNTKTEEFRKLFNERHQQIDFAFIDGCHSYEGIKNDFEVVYPKLSPSGIIAFHDTMRIDGCREFMLDLRTKFNDGTFDLFDFPWGSVPRRVGVSFLVKRSYPVLNLGIDEVCGSLSNPETILQREKDWYINEINKK